MFDNLEYRVPIYNKKNLIKNLVWFWNKNIKFLFLINIVIKIILIKFIYLNLKVYIYLLYKQSYINSLFCFNIFINLCFYNKFKMKKNSYSKNRLSACCNILILIHFSFRCGIKNGSYKTKRELKFKFYIY